jgi:AraC-like DNA-binding protein
MNIHSTSKALFYSSFERSLYLLQLDETHHRANGPSMLIVSLDKQFDVLDTVGNKQLTYSLLIPSGVPITIKTNRAQAAICYLKNTGSDFKKLIPLMANQIKIDSKNSLFSHVKFEELIRAQAKAVWRDSPKACDVLQLLDELINTFDALHNKNINYQADARVIKVIDIITKNLTLNISVNEMATEVGLSTSRLSQLFRAETGTSIRTFRLWQRVFFTARCLQSGMSLTDAAITAGFADYGQFFRVYKEMGGRLPGKAKIQTIIKSG